MSKISGKSGKFMYGSVVVANITEWSMSGFSFSKIKKDPAFNDTVAEYVLDDILEPGTISVKGNYDPDDSAGQTALESAAEAGLGFTNLYLYETANRFWRVGSGGEILVEQCQGITLPRSGFASFALSAQVSGAKMERVS